MEWARVVGERSVVVGSAVVGARFGRRPKLAAWLLAGACALVFLMALASPALAFNDVPATHRYTTAIADLSARGIIGGFPDGSFGPDRQVTRQQFAKMVVLSFALPVTEADISPFSDVQVGGYADPFFPDNYIAVCAANQITKGATPTTFAPGDPIKRAQLLTMVVRAADRLKPGALAATPPGYQGSLPTFDDQTHAANLRKAEHNGLLVGLEGFGAGWDPWAPATRGEVAQVLHSLLQKVGANPLMVTIQADDSRRATATIDSSGGAIDATGADGTKYVLTLPPAAVAGSVDISVVPLSGVGGLPATGGLVGGVKLEPEGLVLSNPGTLTITPPPGTSPPGGQEWFGFGFRANGEAYLCPVYVGAGRITLDVYHFSGKGAAAGTPGDAGDLGSHTPTALGDQWERDAALWDSTKRKEYLEQQWPYIEAGLQNCLQWPDDIRDELPFFLQWKNLVYRWGMEGYFRPQLLTGWGLIEAALGKAVDNRVRWASEQKEIFYVAEIFEIAEWCRNVPEMQRLAEAIRREGELLLNFRLVFHSLMTSMVQDAVADAQFPLYKTNELGMTLGGEGELSESYQWSIPGTTATVTLTPPHPMMQARNLELLATGAFLNGHQGPPFQPKLRLIVPIISEKVKVTHPDGSWLEFSYAPAGFWWANFIDGHRSELDGEAVVIQNWDVVARKGESVGGKVASKKYHRSGDTVEDTTIELYFDPQPSG